MKARWLKGSLAVAFIATLASAGTLRPAHAEEPSAATILKSMSDYLASQKNISATLDTDIEVITPDLQKIQFASSGSLQLSRPDKLHVSRTGGYSDVEINFDGKTFTVFDKAHNVFARSEAPGSVDQLISKLSTDYFIEAPGSDLLLSGVYDELMDDVLDAKYIGRGVIGGVECEHLAFRKQDVDWQIWIEVGPQPIPRKYVITSKAVAAAPQYTLLIRNWKTDAASPEAFASADPAGAKKIEFKELSDIDEVPAGVVKGAQK